jgi:hypothetical protein
MPLLIICHFTKLFNNHGASRHDVMLVQSYKTKKGAKEKKNIDFTMSKVPFFCSTKPFFRTKIGPKTLH